MPEARLDQFGEVYSDNVIYGICFPREPVTQVLQAYLTDPQRNPGHQHSGESPWLGPLGTCLHGSGGVKHAPEGPHWGRTLGS